MNTAELTLRSAGKPVATSRTSAGGLFNSGTRWPRKCRRYPLSRLHRPTASGGCNFMVLSATDTCPGRISHPFCGTMESRTLPPSLFRRYHHTGRPRSLDRWIFGAPRVFRDLLMPLSGRLGAHALSRQCNPHKMTKFNKHSNHSGVFLRALAGEIRSCGLLQFCRLRRGADVHVGSSAISLPHGPQETTGDVDFLNYMQILSAKYSYIDTEKLVRHHIPRRWTQLSYSTVALASHSS